MNLHPYFALVVTAVAAVAFFLVALGIKALAQALDHIGDYLNSRLSRRTFAHFAQHAEADRDIEDAHRQFIAQNGEQR